MTGLIALAADVVDTIDPVTVEEHTTGFSVRVDGGPLVQATLIGDRWSLTFVGKSNDDRCLLDVSEPEARLAATMLAQRLADLEPDRRSYEAQRKALALWLKSLAQGADTEGGDEL